MPNPINRRRYVAPHLREAKALTDQCGEAYIKAWNRPYNLMAEKTMLDIFIRTCPIDCSEDIVALDIAIDAAKIEVPLAKQRLVAALAKFHSLKTDG
jgi:hypothetical protein